jgi:hypothetical protein
MTPDPVSDPPLEQDRPARPSQPRQQPPDRWLARREHGMVRLALRLLLVAVIVAVPAAILVLLGHGWSIGVGVALLQVASVPAVVACALLASASLVRRAACRKPLRQKRSAPSS